MLPQNEVQMQKMYSQVILVEGKSAFIFDWKDATQRKKYQQLL